MPKEALCGRCLLPRLKIMPQPFIATIHRQLTFLQDSEFMSANKMFEEKAKLFTKENDAKPEHKSSIQLEDR